MAQYEEIPSKFAPSDVSLNCTGIQTKHVSKVILREKVVLFASDPGIGTHFIEAYGNTIEKYDGFHLMQYPVPNTHVTVDLFIYNVTSSIFKNRTHLKNHVQNASFFVYLLDQHDSLQSVLERLSVVNDVRIRNGFEDEPIVTLVGNSNLDTMGEVEKYAQDNNVFYFEFNRDAKSDTRNPFKYIAEESYTNYTTALISSETIKLSAL